MRKTSPPTYLKTKPNNKKIHCALTPTWKQLLGFAKEGKDGYWRDVLWTSRTSVSMRLIFETYQEVKKKKDIYVWLPEYFCAETVADFMVEGVHLIKYPLTRRFEPDWPELKANTSPIDIFLHVHFFGEYIDTSRTRTFCEQKNALLIEDCAHVLYDYGKIGEKGDFVLFSPHKLLPVPDGGIICCNERHEDVGKIKKRLAERVQGTIPNSAAITLWKCKKAAQKISKISRNVDLKYEPHILEQNISRETRERISSWSQKTISSYSYEELKKIAYIRRENKTFADAIITSLVPGITVLTTEQNECPFFAAYSLQDVVCPAEAIKQIKHFGFAVSFWPSLSSEGGQETLSLKALELSKNLIVIPVPQTLRLAELAKKLPHTEEKHPADMCFKRLQDRVEDKKEWEDILKRCRFTNIMQDWTYGKIKNKAQHWHVNRYIITEHGVGIGVVQVLLKQVGALKIAARVNHGPLFVAGKQTIGNEVAAMKMIRESDFGYAVFSYVPFSFMNVENYAFMVQHGWINWNRFGFPSGVISLKKTKDELMGSLDSKWRNQLKKALKYNLTVLTDCERYEEMLEIYRNDQKIRQFKGIEDCLIRTMFTVEDTPIRVFYITDESGNIMAFDMFYRHINTATYYIGWNSIEGRSLCLNNLLLYTAAETFRQEGLSYLDLGGIEPIHTEKIAKFKEGMKPEKYQQMGEFLLVR